MKHHAIIPHPVPVRPVHFTESVLRVFGLVVLSSFLIFIAPFAWQAFREWFLLLAPVALVLYLGLMVWGACAAAKRPTPRYTGLADVKRSPERTR